MNPAVHMGPAQWLELFLHFGGLSLLAVGGAITTAPDIHRYLVDEQHWLSDAQFSSSIALAQAAPGPNVLFVALMGWQVGLNAAATLGAGQALSLGLAALGLGVAMAGIMLPSSILTYTATRWAHRHRERLAIRAFKAGMAPIVIALLMATGWLLTAAHHDAAKDWGLWLLTAVATAVVWRTRIHILWLMAFGAALGVLGWV
jgi:chromate transporter